MRPALRLALAAVTLAVVALVALPVVPARADRLGFDPATVYKVPRGAAPTHGAPDAPITIVTWSDHACGYCYRVQPTLAALDVLFPGQLRWVHRTLPLDDDETTSAEAALAAGAQGKFRPMSDRLYAMGGRVDRAAVELIARELGLAMVPFRAALDAHAYRPQIQADAADARALGVSGTPALFVNGRPIHGNQPLAVFVGVVEEELARAQAAGADGASYDALVGAGKLAADTVGGTEHVAQVLEPTATYRVGLGLPGHQLGPDRALVTIVVWSDFQCPFCARIAPVLRGLHARFGDDVRIVFRHLAMTHHRKAQVAAEAAIASAAQGRFWAFHDALFAGFGALERADLERYAAAAGLDLAAFRAALDDRRYRAAVVAERAAGQAIGVDATPIMFLNGQPVVGARDLESLARIVETHAERGRALVRAGLAPTDVYAVLMSDARGSEHGDPSRVPDAAASQITLRADERGRAVAAACRARDPVRAATLARDLTGAPRMRVTAVCAALGIDLGAR